MQDAHVNLTALRALLSQVVNACVQLQHSLAQHGLPGAEGRHGDTGDLDEPPSVPTEAAEPHLTDDHPYARVRALTRLIFTSDPDDS